MIKKKQTVNLNLQEELKFGEQIKQLRLSHNLSLEEIFIRTKISEHFVTNLESENWEHLPAYTFSRGLLVNLLEVYRLAPVEQELLLKKFAATIHGHSQEYQEHDINHKSVNNESETTKTDIIHDDVIARLPGDKDAPDPEKQLDKQFSTGIKLTIIAVVLFVVIVLLWYFFFSFKDYFKVTKSVEENTSTFFKNESRGYYSLYHGYNTFDLVTDDTVKVFFNNQIVDFQLSQILNTFDNRVLVSFKLDNQRIYKVYLFGETWIDIDEDGSNDVLIKFQKQSGEIAVIFFSLLKNPAAEVNFEAIWNNQEKILVDKNEKVLLKSQSKIPIQIFIKATTLPIHLAYNIDGQRQNTLNLRPGNNIKLIANDHLELQIGNFRSAILVVNHMPLKFYVERSNQFGITKIIKWLPSFRNEAKFDLIIKDFIE